MKRLMSFVLLCAAAAHAAPFMAARPVWPVDCENEMNAHVGFAAAFAWDGKGPAPMLRATGCSFYRVRVNGKYVGYGPARAAKGFFRVDEWPLADVVRTGRNEIAIDAAAYHVNTYYVPDQPGFLQAEVVSGNRVLAHTAAANGDFTAARVPRVTKCTRYSFQRGFGEGYRVGTDWDVWTKPGRAAALRLGEQVSGTLIERLAPLPDQRVNNRFKPLTRTAVTRAETIAYRPQRFVENFEKGFKAYKAEELDLNIWREMQHLRVTAAGVQNRQDAYVLSSGEGVVFDAGLNDTGFPAITVTCTKPGRLWMTFDEILSDAGLVDPLRYSVANGIVWDLEAPGTYVLEAFEPYTFRYLHVCVLGGGGVTASAPRVRAYKNPDAFKASFTASDKDLEKIFNAARETFAQNAVDVFTDCPSRERAGWLCDSFFLGRVSALLTGDTRMEKLFIQNYLQAVDFAPLPEGMLPMCYPADHPNRNFIPNWAMWFVLELDEYLARSGDRATVDALKPRLMALKRYLETFENADGLLEKLPAWVFVEWSRANSLVQDVNYPSNMTWAETLECLARLYNLPDCAAKAAKVRAAVRAQAWTGEWFCDNAVRQKDGTLKLSGECTEVCQYYAFFMRTATPETHPALWRRLVEDFGPQRKQTKKHPQIHFANAFIGNYLRLDLLARAGLSDQILRETKGYFKYMADRTGTLWENDGTQASCDHGFASHAAVFYVRDVLGVKAIDARAKTVTLGATDAALAFGEARLPVPGGTVTVTRTVKDGQARQDCAAPAGWKVLRKE